MLQMLGRFSLVAGRDGAWLVSWQASKHEARTPSRLSDVPVGLISLVSSNNALLFSCVTGCPISFVRMKRSSIILF